MQTNHVEALMASNPDDWSQILERDYAIKIVRDGELASLKYNQIESPMHEPIVQQCRGMVVDASARSVLGWSYNKFWNHGEALADQIDWSTARVQEKLDGSLMILYWHGGRWCVASSGHPTAGGSFGSDNRTFREAFWSTVGALDFDVTQLDPGITYSLELCDSPNRVVVRHDKPRLVLHGARLLMSGEELGRDHLEHHAKRSHCELVDEFQIGSIGECLAAADAIDPIISEGFVVVDAAFRRVKIKSPRYVILHHMRGDATPRRAIELWQTGETGELLAHFPEMSSAILPVHERLDEIARRAADEHDEALCRSFDRKSYASMATRYPFSSAMFRMLADGVAGPDAAKAIMRRQTLASLERMVAS